MDEITLDEYKYLVSIAERLECLKCYLNTCKCPDVETIKIITGCEEMGIVYE